jgi:hypothetical protein
MKNRNTWKENLAALAAKYGGQTELAKKVGKSKAWISQLIGKNPKRPVGDVAASKIEKKLGLPEGWLDSTHKKATVNQEILIESVQLVWDVLGEEKVTLPALKMARLVAAVYSRLETGPLDRAEVRELVGLAS